MCMFSTCFVLTTTVCADCRVVKMIGRLQFQGIVLQLVLLQATNAHHNKQIHFQFPIISLGTGTMSIHAVVFKTNFSQKSIMHEASAITCMFSSKLFKAQKWIHKPLCLCIVPLYGLVCPVYQNTYRYFLSPSCSWKAANHLL